MDRIFGLHIKPKINYFLYRAVPRLYLTRIEHHLSVDSLWCGVCCPRCDIYNGVFNASDYDVQFARWVYAEDQRCQRDWIIARGGLADLEWPVFNLTYDLYLLALKASGTTAMMTFFIKLGSASFLICSRSDHQPSANFVLVISWDDISAE